MKKDTSIAAAITFVKSLADEEGYVLKGFSMTRFVRGEATETEERVHVSSLIEWLEKFPKYFQSFSPNSGRILVGNQLYKLPTT